MRLPDPYRPEIPLVERNLALLEGRLDWGRVVARARPWIDAVRRSPPPFWAVERLLTEYPISRPEGLALMRLAEGLLRVPDAETAIELTADQLARAEFEASAEHGLARLSSAVIALSKQYLLPAAGEELGLLARLGARTTVAATVRAVQLLAQQFVIGETIEAALEAARAERAEQPAVCFSFDMLGEGARSEADARRYAAAYHQAVEALRAARGSPSDRSPQRADGLSIKLSALHPRYEALKRERVLEELVPRISPLLDVAAKASLNLTIDAEESDRLELSLDVFERLLVEVAAKYRDWGGFGLALQAYQTRAVELVDHVAELARRYGLRLMCRLVKGAYWDSEIKRAQELGVQAYPVFTEKPHADVSYLACAVRLFAARDVIYPQFATHNAVTIAAIEQLAQAAQAPFELQRLHGMGRGIYRAYLADRPLAEGVRVYAPVGRHRDLLAYLVRRLLENGANSSFVHQLADPSVPVEVLLESPLRVVTPSLPLPPAIYRERANSRGLDVTVERVRDSLREVLARVESEWTATAAWNEETAPQVVSEALAAARRAFPDWRDRKVAERAALLRAAADRLEREFERFCAQLVVEARKTWVDAIAEVRETVDFLRYYAAEAERICLETVLPGPTGEDNRLRLRGRGVWVAISPWNFPLAILTGQVAAALVTGNTVLAKPAEQTPRIAQAMTALLHEVGVPRDVLHCLPGRGETVGARLVAAEGIAGVVFTGSTSVAKAIQRALAAKDGPIVPLIAETGGINAMIVDSTALPEHVVDAVVQSAFRSAGQRCSALRLLCLHEAVAGPILEMLAGAMQDLHVGDPRDFATDVGPLIDAEAYARVVAQCAELERSGGRRLAVTPLDCVRHPPPAFAPVLYEIPAIETAREEIFAPVVQVVRWSGSPEAVVDRINALGYGLTLGLQTRIDRRAETLAARAAIGNVYVNRSMIGAVVGAQPFGGEGLSGTGPKAGGPHYLLRFLTEQTISINLTAAGGNVALLTREARRA
ncbi:MAG: bifunctional proline dehydrogenase/L-glutamate gamma-semialdehyde dehydrogenase PutA [Casimicrobiaceae bacterium]|nr:bifunctional proline dehydrogenase/L-glutamate gamma-semialdehyde dehydrogenase PutA [Casimicrobiaceae bacterium]MDW8311233.1 bifunctional proline dehydrogenase/L-glutamate gamma-semialdehyde dehydrogenase PutA [Burkholderiales bacterium]